MIIPRQATTTVVVRSLPPQRSNQRLLTRERKKTTRSGRAIGILAVLMVSVFGFLFSSALPGTQAPAAKAWPWDGIAEALCFYSDPNTYVTQPEPWPGLIGALGIVTRETAEGAVTQGLTGNVNAGWTKRYTAADQPTAYEWYGTAGLQWKDERYKDLGAECIPIASAAGNMVANVVQFVGLAVGEIGLIIFGWANDLNAFDPFFDTINQVVWSLTDALFLEYLIPIVMLGALWIGWQGLVKKRSSEALQGIVWMVLASGASIFFLTQPAAIAKQLNGVVMTVQSQITGSAVSIASGQDTDLCGLTGDVATVEQYRVAQCQIWQTFMFAPWAAGQFGPTADANVQVAGTVDDYSTAVRIPGRGETNNMVLVYYNSQVMNHNEVFDLAAAVGGNQEAKDALGVSVNEKSAQWRAVYDKLLDDPSLVASRGYFTGNEWSGRLGIAFVNIAAMAFGAIPIMFLAFTLVIFQLGFVLLIFASPLFLTLGIHPGFGRKIALGWVEMLLSVSIKRIGTSVLLAILLATFMAVTRSTDSWIAKTVIVGAISVALLLYRKRLLESVSRISLGGDGSNSVSGAGQQIMGRGKSMAMRGASAAMGRTGGDTGIGSSLAAGVVGGFVGQTFGRRIATRSAQKQRQQRAQEVREQQEQANQEKEWKKQRQAAEQEALERQAENELYETDYAYRARVEELARERWRRRIEAEDEGMYAAAERINDGRSTVQEEVQRVLTVAQRNQNRGDVNWNVVTDVSGVNPEFASALDEAGLNFRPEANDWTRPGSAEGAPVPDRVDVENAKREVYRSWRVENTDVMPPTPDYVENDAAEEPKRGPTRPF